LKKKGHDFVQKELARLHSLMDGNVAPKKRDEFNIKHNILKAFHLEK